jgi:lipopolysaccharide export LptBFGC system permease protein LptF
VLQLFFIVLFVEAILLAEKLNDVLRAAMNRQAQFPDILQLLLFKTPSVFDLALPLALLIAVYRTALRHREDRELLVLSGVGLGSAHFVALSMAVGLAAQLVSLFISGVVDPRAQFAARSTLFASEYEALRGGITPGQLYFFGNYTVYAIQQARKTENRPLFISQRGVDGDNTDRTINAERASLVGPDNKGNLSLLLRDFVVLDYAHGRTDSPSGVVQSGRMRLGQYERELALEQLIRFEPRGHSPGEWTTLELVQAALAPAGADARQVAEAGRRLARSLLCLMAPLIAGLALAFTNRATQSFALPAACAVLMGFDLGVSALVENQAHAGMATTALILIGAALVVIGGLVHQLILRQHAIVMPALARA